MRGSRGFSFIELVLVVAVIAILAAFSVPHLQRIRITVQEKNALATVRAFFEAEALHHTRFQIYGDLSSLVENEFVDNSYSDGLKSGYRFYITDISRNNFQVKAVPIEQGVSGEKGFFVDATGVIRYTNDGSAPGSESSPWN